MKLAKAAAVKTKTTGKGAVAAKAKATGKRKMVDPPNRPDGKKSKPAGSETKLGEALKEAATHLPGKELTKEERRAALMRFIRCRDSRSVHQRKAPMPQEVKDDLAKNPENQDAIFIIWVRHDEDFAKASAFINRIRRTVTQDVGQERWRTFSQLVKFSSTRTLRMPSSVNSLRRTRGKTRRLPSARRLTNVGCFLKTACQKYEDILERNTQGKADIDRAGNQSLFKRQCAAPASSSLSAPGQAGTQGGGGGGNLSPEEKEKGKQGNKRRQRQRLQISIK